MEKHLSGSMMNLMPISQARVPVNDRGFLYGDGLFETLRADAGRVHFLTEHLERLAASARAFRLPFPENIPWQERLAQLLAANGLSRGPARVKILLTRGVAPGLGLPEECRPTLVIYAQAVYASQSGRVRRGLAGGRLSRRPLHLRGPPQEPQLPVLPGGPAVRPGPGGQRGPHPGGRRPGLGRGRHQPHLSPSGALLPARLGQRPSRGDRNGPGPGVSRPGPALKARRTTVAQLQAADGLWLANSLMGLMPVAAVNGAPVPVSAATAFLQEVLADMS